MDLVLLLQRVFDAPFNSAIFVVGTGPSHYFAVDGVAQLAQGEMATFTAYIAFVLWRAPNHV